MMFTSFIYTYNLANAVSFKCLELTNFPWVMLYMFGHRFTVIAQVGTLMCMSFARVMLFWRADIYMQLNSRFTVNMATVLILSITSIDIIIHINKHVFQQCIDSMQIKVYEAEFKRSLCIPEGYDISNSTICEVYEKAENVYPIGCKACRSYPIVSTLLGFLFLFEMIKFFVGFYRNFKKFNTSIRKRLGPNVNTPALQNQIVPTDVQKTIGNTAPSNGKTEPTFSVIQVKEYNQETEVANMPIESNIDHNPLQTVSALIASKELDQNNLLSYSATPNTTVKHEDTNIVKESLPDVDEIHLAAPTNPTVSDINKRLATAIQVDNFVENFEKIELAPVLGLNDISSSQEVQLKPPGISTVGLSSTVNVFLPSVSNRENAPDTNEARTKKSKDWKTIFGNTFKESMLTIVLRTSTWTFLLYTIVLFIFIVSFEPASSVYILKRLEAYLNPVFWFLTDDKVMLFYTTKLSKLKRIYNISG